MHRSATPEEARRGFGSLRAVCQEQNRGPLQEKQTLLTTELPIPFLFRYSAKSGRTESTDRK